MRRDGSVEGRGRARERARSWRNRMEEKRAGRNPAPLRVTILTSSSSVTSGYTCCTARRLGPVFRPRANRITTLRTNFRVRRDIDTARKAYAMDAADRRQAGLTDLALLQSIDDPNNLLGLWAVADVARATAFFDSPALAAHMANNAGVVGKPERHIGRPGAGNVDRLEAEVRDRAGRWRIGRTGHEDGSLLLQLLFE